MPRRVITETPRAQDQSDLRVANTWRVLQVIRASGVTSRTRVAAETGLTLTTVHRISADLRRRRLILRAGMSAKGSVGRPSALYRFNIDAGYVVGIDVGNETIRAVAANLGGTILARASHPTQSVETDLAGGIERLVGEVTAAASLQPAALVALGIGVAAVTETSGLIVRASVHHPWEGLELGGQLRRILGCDVIVAQDDHLAALAELHRGAAVGVRNAVVLNMGKGIGAGLITDGTVYYGAHSAAGRLAWIPVPAEGTGPHDLVPLGQLLTADGLINDYRRFGGAGTIEGALDVFRADAAGDSAACRAIDLFADRLGWLMAAAVAVIDPQRIIIGGGISGSFARLSTRAVARLHEIVAFPPPVVGSELGTAAVALGAVDAALQLADAWMLTRID